MHYYLSGFDCGGRFRCRFCIPSRCPAPPVISFCFGVSQRGAIDVIGRRPPKSHANTETDAKEWKMRHWDTERLRQRELRLSSWWRTLFGIDEPPRVTLNRPTDGVGFRLIQCHHLTGFFQHSALIFFFFFLATELKDEADSGISALPDSGWDSGWKSSGLTRVWLRNDPSSGSQPGIKSNIPARV